MTTAFVGIGSNLDEPARQVSSALDALDRMPHTRVVKRSSLYRSAPVGYANQPDFVNAVAQLETGIPAERLLSELQEVEKRHGRARSFANAPRTLDLDQTIRDAIVLMQTGRYRNVPLVDEAGHLVGVVRQADIIKYLAESFPEELLNLPPRPHQRMKEPEGA